MISLEHILVATDLRAPSDAALAYGCELARRFNDAAGAQLDDLPEREFVIPDALVAVVKA